MKNFSLLKLLYTGLFASMTAMFLISGFAIWGHYQAAKVVNDMHKHPFTILDSIRETRANVRLIWELANKAVYQDVYIDAESKQINDAEEKIERYIALVKSRYLGNHGDVEDVERAYKTLNMHMRKAIEIRNSDGAKKAVEYLKDNNVEESYYRFSSEVDDVIKFAQNKAEEFKSRTISMFEEELKRQIAVALLVLAATVGTGILVMRYVKNRFAEINSAVESIKHGNYKNMQIENGGLAEFSNLKETINQMAYDMAEQQKVIQGQNEVLTEQARTLEETNVELDASYEEVAQTNDMLRSRTRELEIAQEQFRQIFENMSSGVVVYAAFEEGRDFIFKSINAAAAKMDVVDRAQVIDRRLSEVFPGVEEFGFLDALKRVYTSGEAERFPLAFYEDSRISGWRENFIYKLSTGEIVAIYDDVTERKQNEEATIEANKNLKKAESLARLGNWYLDLRTNKLAWSDGIFDIFEIDKDRFGATYEAFLAGIHPDDRDAVNQAYIDSLLTKKGYEITHRLLMDDGRIKYVSEQCETYFDENGAPLRSIGTVQDITERQIMEDQLRELNKDLAAKVEEETAKRLEKEKMLLQQSKMAMMGEMIGAIAHQWRQPLNALGLSIQDATVAYEYGELNGEYMKEFKSTNMSIIQKMSKTIDDFRNFFRTTKEKSDFALEDAVGETLNIMKSQLRNNYITVNFDKDSRHIISGYQSELEQAILIIISNAQDALIDNSIKEPMINIAVEGVDDKVVLSIQDNGGGVREDIMDRVFEPYFTTKEQGKGTGIGLYMAKEIVERNMGGKLSVKNSGHGARFMIELG